MNTRVREEELEPCMFGFMLSRLFHYVVRMRQELPSTIIWIRKEDFKSAFRRVHLNAETSWKSVVRLPIDGVDLLLVSLRLPFGGAPCPAEFCLISDVITDTVNDLLEDTSWNHNTVRSEYTAEIPEAQPLPPDIPFAKARELSVDIPVSLCGKADVYIDDVVTCAVDVGDNLERIKAAPCTVIHAVAHKASGNTHLKRQGFISDDKTEAEGAPAERKIVLGWMVDTRQLLVSLPSHKFIAWSNEIHTLMRQQSVNSNTMMTVLGRLETVASMLTPLGHFLNNLRSLQLKAEEKGHNVPITDDAREDMALALDFIKHAHQGISMNLLVFRAPSLIFVGDASEHGLGGFDTSGRAWRYLIPEHLRGRAHINLLEFMTQVVGTWLAIDEGRLGRHDCLLAMGDSTTALGWLRRSNFRENGENNQDWRAKQKVARKLAGLVLDSETLLYKQWFKGSDNVVTDSLSRDLYYMSPNTHTKFLQLTVPQQLPNNFRIQQLPDRISCFILSTLQLLPVQARRLMQPKASELVLGNPGMLSYMVSDLKAQYSSKDVMHSNATSSSLPSPKLSERVLTLQDLKETWWKARSVPPSYMWHRPSGQTIGRIPDWTQMGEHVSS